METKNGVSEAPRTRPSRENLAFAAIVVVLVLGLMAVLIKRAFDESINRGLGEGLAKTASGASDALSKVTHEDIERFFRAGDAVLDLVAPPDKEGEKPPFRKALDLVASTARREVRQEGILEAWLLDQVTEELGQDAEKSRGDEDRLSALSMASILKLKDAQNGDEAATLAARIDQALDDALKLNGSLWRARFSKAGLCYLRAPSGRRQEAIRQFEALLDQETVPPRSEFALTYLFLGNLYLEEGSKLMARKTWSMGLSVFPGHKGLAERLEAFPESPPASLSR